MEQIMPNASVLVQAVIFLVALYVIKVFILNPISQVLAGRTEKIDGSEQEARRFAEEASKLDATCRARVAEARSRAQQARARTRDEARGEERAILDRGRQEAQRILDGIRAEILKESKEARGRLRGEAAGLSRMLTEKLLGRQVS
jgi:F-type H+-transporting ATPase subunit b